MNVLNYFRKAIFCLVLLLFAANTDVFAGDSVLKEGVWYKMSISSTGMYKLTYSDLSAMGVDVANINPKKIRVFHNGGGTLPKVNKTYYPDDLYEIPIYVEGESDGVFDQDDYLIFYARGPVVWRYYNYRQYYGHVKNPYTDYTYIFLTVGETDGRRITTGNEPEGAVAEHVGDFIDYQVIDKDEYNVNNMGCTWFFDKFDITLQREYEFAFSNLNTSKNVKMRASIASKNLTSAVMTLKYNDMQIYSKSFAQSTTYLYASWDTSSYMSFKAMGSPIKIDAKYTRASSSSVAWMDYLSINVWRYLKMTGDVMQFRNPECKEANLVYQYDLQDANANIKIWDVTDPINPAVLKTTLSATTLSFKARGNRDNQYVAFNGKSFNKPTFVGIVGNQNLHSLKDVDYLIITHPRFQAQAERLKEIHSHLDDLNIEIVQPQYIYNEFSCGAQDVGGIRGLVRMLYNNVGGSAERKLKYVLLFGDSSYDYKNPDVCLIPTWESFQSTYIIYSLVSDDFYVCLDENDGRMESSNSMIDIPIGRMPVTTVEQANDVLDKIEAYVARTPETMDNWRNVVTMMCDDESNEFINNSEFLARNIPSWGGNVIVDKIYLDAYNQVATASGQRCPEINEALTNRIERGTLVVNYNGHGGEIGLGEERILTIDDINSWDNMPMMPLFVTATCEFSRFDDHTRTSAGELLFLNKRGGAIEMITTTRTTGGSHDLLERTYQRMFRMVDGEYPTIGEIFLNAKQDNSNNTRVFTLFGDPALRLAYPKYNVTLRKINNHNVASKSDTIKALSSVTLYGEVTDNFGETMTDFNGIVRVSVYDKENTYQTKGDHGWNVVDFNVRNSLLFDGKADVNAGEFTISFTVPKDINYSYGPGLISFYATDYERDANGMFTNIIVGGYDNTALPDVDGPKARIFIDDTLFVSGGITNENPVFYAFVKDEHGINTTGVGIGHDITATLTGATKKTYTLNSYYDAPANPDDYGKLAYRFYGLNEGEHHLNFRVWDIYNNSTNVSIDFTVVKSSYMIVENVYNAPNPMTSHTKFYFEHNQKGNLDITISIYNVNGQIVKTINESRYGTSTRVEPIEWDGCSDGGTPLKSGVYIYNVTITGDDNVKHSTFSKLVIAR